MTPRSTDHNRTGISLLALVAIASLLGMHSVSAAAQFLDEVDLVNVISGLSEPVAIRHAGDGSGRLFIVEQRGRILVWDGESVTTFLDIESIVLDSGFEQGLLGLAFHPDFEKNRHFYVNFTRGSGAGETVVSRYTVAEGGTRVIEGSGVDIIVINQTSTNHNGGDIHFSPNDGYLYIGMGDGGGSGDAPCNAQHLDRLLGKILRIDVDGGFPYVIPPSNPFLGIPGEDEIWAYGLRNPWRWSFDRLTGDLWVGDVGQLTREEVDFQPAASSGGENYGWKVMEGTTCFDPDPIDTDCPIATPSCFDPSYEPPIFDYPSVTDCSVIGGYRYRGSKTSALEGVYLFSDWCTGKIWSTTPDGGGGWTTTLEWDTSLAVSAFGEDEDGELYVADWGTGDIYLFLGREIFADGFESGDVSAWTTP